MSEEKSLSHVQLLATPWTVAYQASPSMGFSRQEYWSGLPFPSPEDLPNPGIEPGSPALEADALTSEPPGKPHNKDKAEHKNKRVNPTRGCKICKLHAYNKGASKHTKANINRHNERS